MRMALISSLLLLSFSLHSAELKNFKLKNYSTKEDFDFSKAVGSKKIVLNFWASWCTSCIEELPLLHELQSNNTNENVIFLGINSGEKKKKIKRFLKRNDFKYTILMDSKKELAKHFKVENLPQTIVINKEGKVQFRGNRPPLKL